MMALWTVPAHATLPAWPSNRHPERPPWAFSALSEVEAAMTIAKPRRLALSTSLMMPAMSPDLNEGSRMLIITSRTFRSAPPLA
ncbi:MAG: hypothetical protein MZU97_27190 [Bacillus subtilis]|nr:hypothetical protein [Bacillus subtilis]